LQKDLAAIFFTHHNTMSYVHQVTLVSYQQFLLQRGQTDRQTDRQLACAADNIDCALVDACKDSGVSIFYYIR